jgi:hypothetical protein
MEIVKSNNTNINKERLVKKIISNFKDLKSDDEEDLKKYLDYIPWVKN